MAFCSSTLFFFNNPATTEIYTLSLHDALPISGGWNQQWHTTDIGGGYRNLLNRNSGRARSEEHTSELQSHVNLVCRLLLEKKKTTTLRSIVTKRTWTIKSAIALPTT